MLVRTAVARSASSGQKAIRRIDADTDDRLCCCGFRDVAFIGSLLRGPNRCGRIRGLGRLKGRGPWNRIGRLGKRQVRLTLPA